MGVSDHGEIQIYHTSILRYLCVHHGEKGMLRNLQHKMLIYERHFLAEVFATFD